MDQTLAALPSPSTGQPGKELSGEISRSCTFCGQAHWAQLSRADPAILVPSPLGHGQEGGTKSGSGCEEKAVPTGMNQSSSL